MDENQHGGTEATEVHGGGESMESWRAQRRMRSGGERAFSVAASCVGEAGAHE